MMVTSTAGKASVSVCDWSGMTLLLHCPFCVFEYGTPYGRHACPFFIFLHRPLYQLIIRTMLCGLKAVFTNSLFFLSCCRFSITYWWNASRSQFIFIVAIYIFQSHVIFQWWKSTLFLFLCPVYHWILRTYILNYTFLSKNKIKLTLKL